MQNILYPVAIILHAILAGFYFVTANAWCSWKILYFPTVEILFTQCKYTLSYRFCVFEIQSSTLKITTTLHMLLTLYTLHMLLTLYTLHMLLTLYTLRTLLTLYTLHMLLTLYTLHMLLTLYTLRTLLTLYTLHMLLTLYTLLTQPTTTTLNNRDSQGCYISKICVSPSDKATSVWHYNYTLI